MLNPRKTSAVERVFGNLQTGRSRVELHPGEKVEVLDVFGRPTGIYCTVQKAEMHSVGVVWGGETIMIGRSWLRRVN
jgi:predicted CoA-binding protein